MAFVFVPDSVGGTLDGLWIELLTLAILIAREFLHWFRHKRLKEELEERSHEANCYLEEFGKLDTPPPQIPPRKPRQTVTKGLKSHLW